jgi:tRNA-specific 2-thiouridylase
MRVVVGLSGGVDSSVAAHLLMEAGHEVIGMYMRNWSDDRFTLNNECPWVEDANDAMAVAEHLGIPFQTIDLSDAYKSRIVDYMFSEYASGRTPNPDVLCNREIKFDLFLKAAISLGAEAVATGHYCQKGWDDASQQHRLLAGADRNKDQSYFLCQISQEQLSKALFPIGHLQKSEVRAIADEIGLPTAKKKDSQGLCFVGKISLPEFLQQQLTVKRGEVIEIASDWMGYDSPRTQYEEESRPFHYLPSDGKIIGHHDGAHFFTVGQRKGLNIGGKPEPLFVIATNTETNTIYVGMGETHRGLNRKSLFVTESEMHWIRPDLKMQTGEQKEFMVRIRYRQPLQKAIAHQHNEGMFFEFEQFQKGITPGQFIAFYSDDEVIGSGVISG